MTRIETLVRDRTEKRKARAIQSAINALSGLRNENIDVFVIGSLASNSFMHHSDVDYLVEGRIAPQARGRIEAVIAHAMADSGIGYDVVYAEDVRPELLEDFRHVKADAPRLSQLAQEVGKSRSGSGQSDGFREAF